VEQRNVGKSGLRVGSVGLGCNNFGWLIDEDTSRTVIGRALDLGATLFDTAPRYGKEGGESESILGKVLGDRRKNVVIITKFGVPLGAGGPPNTSRAVVLESAEASLRRLRTDHIDIFMLHWPDPKTPLEETLRALDDLVTAGKVRYIGCSNLVAWQLVESKWISRTERLHGFIIAQNEYSILSRRPDTDLIPALVEYGVGFIPYSPLANGLLTGKYSRRAAPPAESRLGKNTWKLGDRLLTEEKLALVEALDEFARARGHKLIELATSWLLARPTVCSVIAGATRPEQVEQNLSAGEWRLSADELAEVDRICRGSGGKGAS
jgi:aryl-alcohol dehydrogenase-like predicted oxidoreductase